jgi:hypothetical protein
MECAGKVVVLLYERIIFSLDVMAFLLILCVILMLCVFFFDSLYFLTVLA